MKSLNFNSQERERELHQLQQMQHKAKKSCMKSFRLLHSHLKVLSVNDLKRPGSEGGYERAFASFFDQDVQTFTRTTLLNLDYLAKQINKEEFQENRFMAAFWVINKKFQMFIDSQFTWDYDSQMIEKMNERQMQSKEGMVDSCKALDASLVVTEYSAIESENTIRLVNDQVPSAEIHLTAQYSVLANEQQHYVQSEHSYETHLLENIDSNTTPDSTNMCPRRGEIA
nr:hypothetical protein [Tanacetum cinerariifolium]